MRPSIYITLVVLSLITASLAALVARRKGKSPLLWFVVGFVLNLLTLIAAVLLFQTAKDALRRKEPK